MERRTLIKSLGGLLLMPSLAIGHTISAEKPVLRFAHLTDIHLKDEFDAPARFAKCLHKLQQTEPKLDFILNGGDVVFDMNKQNLNAISAQWKQYHNVLKAESSLPVHYCLGNHDIWWDENNKGQTVYGKQYALDQLGMPGLYYSFVKNGWKFILLDSVHLDLDGTWYIGKLGEQQIEWLENELRNTNPSVPVVVLSHIPILSSTVLIAADNASNGYQILGGDMHVDARRIVDIFCRYPNVKLSLSGHTHLRDKVVYNDVTYICNGAVSGAWWEGNRQQTAPGYGVIDLFADGTFEEKYVNY